MFNFTWTLYCLHYLMYHCSNLYHLGNNNDNNNYPYVIFICLQPFCKPHLYFIQYITEMFKHATQDFLITTNSYPVWQALSYAHVFSLFSEKSIAKASICAFSYLSVPHVCCCWFIWKAFNVCVYTLTLVAFAFVVFSFSISFVMMVFVFVAFAYYFHVNVSSRKNILTK